MSIFSSKELVASGEKEWYFYCPWDRKYRNSAPPNRVTGVGFWKTFGTDWPMAQRAFPHSWVSTLPETLVSDMFTQGTNCTQFNSENISSTIEIGFAIQFCSTNDLPLVIRYALFCGE